MLLHRERRATPVAFATPLRQMDFDGAGRFDSLPRLAEATASTFTGVPLIRPSGFETRSRGLLGQAPKPPITQPGRDPAAPEGIPSETQLFSGMS